MNHRLSLSRCCIAFLIVAPAGCSRVSDSVGPASGSAPAVTSAQLADFNEAMAVPAAGLFGKDWKTEFADAVKESFGPDKASLDKARKVRDELLAILDSAMEKIHTSPTPYVPEAWALRQAIQSFLGTMRDVSSTHMDEILELAADDSLDTEDKMDRCSKLHLRQANLMASAQANLNEASAAWEAYMKVKSSTN